MALDGTYAGLQASVADFLNRSDLTASIPDFIRLAEGQMNRRLRVNQMLTYVTASVSSNLFTVPADFLQPHTFVRSDGLPLTQKSPDQLFQMSYEFPSGTLDGSTQNFAVMGNGLQIYPGVSSATTFNLLYYQALPALATYAANWLLTSYPDAYLYGALTQAAPYLRQDDRLEVWGNLFTQAIADIQAADGDVWGANPLPQPSFTQII